MNKILFFGKVVVPTFYPFARLVRNNLGQNKSSLCLNRLTASKLYSESQTRRYDLVLSVLNA
ncbi:hypothetical protein LIH_13480 [Leptospira interrogans serovar Hardjo-prajitno]|uniref:Uncharacterized protein n=1 Tax=Leptospira interrogans serovar Hardjo str. Norma TaxID=1279460 RepID=A0A0M4MW05_LEPIR|nr:hypothetical protein G436_3380 [Leptospira interrogans serovar Hardjo str. Norma]ALO01364.1 hypothetical protein LIH_13480 [Leptospira interrogans serovar Hardjo-prajitno]EKO96199.1 hypothetical protein LEP1GSC057_4371 [Leptospira interrogans str. Brem 329]